MFDFTELIVFVGVLLILALLLLGAPIFPKVGAAFLKLVKPYRNTLKPRKRAAKKAAEDKGNAKTEKALNASGHGNSDDSQKKDKTGQ